MKEEEINKRIAEACGWKPDNRGFGWLDPNGCYTQIPNYSTDLNAMHEAEKSLSETNMFVMAHYAVILENIDGSLFGILATARQRAEAFLRTLGKWEEVQA